MTLPRLPDYIDHMLEANEQALIYVEGLPKDDFLEDKRTQQAVVLNLIVIGEASTKIIKDYAEFAEANTQIPWSSMKGMRNRIAHGYYDINLDTVWETIQTALPELGDQLLAVKAKL
jgi:uncharacterized protein with HEPN domain